MSGPENAKPIALDAFETLAERYAALVDDKPHNAHYERPATLSLLPDVAGLHALDAGCGPGVYAEWLLQHGARVTAIDASPKMVALARQRLSAFGDAVVVRRADLNQPLDFLESASFDLVIAPLVLDYIEHWTPLFAEFGRVLRRTGLLIFSLGHPCADFKYSPTGDYFAVEVVEATWRGFGGDPVVVPFYRRPLSAIFAPLWETGFVAEQVVEPRPTEAFRQKDPKDYMKLSRQPGFICIRARKR